MWYSVCKHDNDTQALTEDDNVLITNSGSDCIKATQPLDPAPRETLHAACSLSIQVPRSPTPLPLSDRKHQKDRNIKKSGNSLLHLAPTLRTETVGSGLRGLARWTGSQVKGKEGRGSGHRGWRHRDRNRVGWRVRGVC